VSFEDRPFTLYCIFLWYCDRFFNLNLFFYVYFRLIYFYECYNSKLEQLLCYIVANFMTRRLFLP
jgi:hypothetical protein